MHGETINFTGYMFRINELIHYQAFVKDKQ